MSLWSFENEIERARIKALIGDTSEPGGKPAERHDGPHCQPVYKNGEFMGCPCREEARRRERDERGPAVFKGGEFIGYMNFLDVDEKGNQKGPTRPALREITDDYPRVNWEDLV
jgi:hypothetical protein